MIKRFNTLILIGLISMISSTTAYATRACRVHENGVPKEIIQRNADRSDLIFIGKVSSLQEIQDDSIPSFGRMYVAQIEVNEWIKGQVDQKTVNVVFSTGLGFCHGLHKENIGDQVKIYISKDGNHNGYRLRFSEIMNP